MYKTNHTGANTQAGGAIEGEISELYQDELNMKTS